MKDQNGCGIPSDMPPCGSILFFTLFTKFSCIKKIVQSCKYIGLLGHSSPQYQANSIHYWSYTKPKDLCDDHT